MQNVPQMSNMNPKSTKPHARDTLIGRLVGSPLFWIIFVAFSFGIPIVQSLRAPKVIQPPVLAQLEDFQLTNQDNKKLKLSDFQGSVLVVNFFFTNCAGNCSRLTQQMGIFQKRLMGVGPAIRLLSITVDPDTDTPEKLKEYAEKYQADFKIWQFLTGDRATIEKVVGDGFQVALDKNAKTVDERFVIVDQLGRIRGYKQANDNTQLSDIIRIVAILANSNPNQTP